MSYIITNKHLTFSIVPMFGFGFMKSNVTMTDTVKFETKIFLFACISMFYTKTSEFSDIL